MKLHFSAVRERFFASGYFNIAGCYVYGADLVIRWKKATPITRIDKPGEFYSG